VVPALVDAEGYVHRAEMRAPGHFMDHRCYDYDAPITIDPRKERADETSDVGLGGHGSRRGGGGLLSAGDAPSPGQGPIAVGHTAPTLSLKSSSGATVALSEYAGKPVLVYFSVGPG
jgi:hypothetical protein